jgi:hypothetical protein
LLHDLGISVLVTTYQAGKLVLLRSDGDQQRGAPGRGARR